MGIKSYRDLVVWNKAMDLVETAYRVTSKFPTRERYGLASQMQRAAVSIPANIAEGYGRATRGDYGHHLSIARGSLAEFETLLMIGVRLQFVTREDVVDAWNLAQEVGRMLTTMILSVKGIGNRD